MNTLLNLCNGALQDYQPMPAINKLPVDALVPAFKLHKSVLRHTLTTASSLGVFITLFITL